MLVRNLDKVICLDHVFVMSKREYKKQIGYDEVAYAISFASISDYGVEEWEWDTPEQRDAVFEGIYSQWVKKY